MKKKINLQAYLLRGQCHPNTHPASLPKSSPERLPCTQKETWTIISYSKCRVVRNHGVWGKGDVVSSLALRLGPPAFGAWGLQLLPFCNGSGGVMTMYDTQRHPREAKTRTSS